MPLLMKVVWQSLQELLLSFSIAQYVVVSSHRFRPMMGLNSGFSQLITFKSRCRCHSIEMEDYLEGPAWIVL